MLEGKIKRSSSDRWCSTKGQPLAPSAVHYLLTVSLTLALLQESSVMQIIKCYFIVQGLLQVQQEVCKVIPSCCAALRRMPVPASAWTACTVKMKRKSFRAHLPGLPLTKTFSSLFPVSHPEQDSQGHICHNLRWLQQLTDHLCQRPQETSPARLLRTRGRLERSGCTAPSAAAVERESATTARQRSGRDLLPFCSSGIVLAMP